MPGRACLRAREPGLVRCGRRRPRLVDPQGGGALARDAVAHGARAVVLAHLSSENNTPEHARAAVERILSACGALADGVTLAVAPRSEPGPTYAL